MTLFDQPSDAPSRRIVEHLQRQGPSTVRALEGVLGVTTTAVRAQLATLLADGYVERRAVHQGVGRPHHAYALTTKARELYACHCDDLALTLLQEVFAMEGVERATWLLERVGDKLAKRYAGEVRGEGLRARVEQMAQVLQQRGVLTDVEPATALRTDAAGLFDAERVDLADENVFLLKAYNCPFHELAQEHREICAMDERMLHKVLGADVQLDSCMMDGHTRCTFVVRPAAAGNGAYGDAPPAAQPAAAERFGPPAALQNGHTPPAYGAPVSAALAPAAAPWYKSGKEEKEGKGGKKKKHKKGR